jgi:hypothetical protein
MEGRLRFDQAPMQSIDRGIANWVESEEGSCEGSRQRAVELITRLWKECKVQPRSSLRESRLFVADRPAGQATTPPAACPLPSLPFAGTGERGCGARCHHSGHGAQQGHDQLGLGSVE